MQPTLLTREQLGHTSSPRAETSWGILMELTLLAHQQLGHTSGHRAETSWFKTAVLMHRCC